MDNPALVGTWKLVLVSASPEKGETDRAPYGLRPTGFVTYTQDGRVAVIISESGRKRLSIADRHAASLEERADAFATCFSYAGRYTVTGDSVTHSIEAASVGNWVGTELIRLFRIEGNRMTLRTPLLPHRGQSMVFELAWERMK